MTDAAPLAKREPEAHLGSGARPTDTSLVVSPHHLASEAGANTMRAGGNAVDAAIVANSVLGVVLPETCGPGGDLFALVHQPGSERPHALNATGRAGSGISADDLRARGLQAMPDRGPLTVTVPGCIDGWEALHRRFGVLPLRDLMAPAVGIARNGFSASRELADQLARSAAELIGQASANALFPDDAPPAPGDLLRRPDLATTLEDVGASGRDAFYGGRVGAAVAKATEGAITKSDLEENHAEWVAPLSIDVMGLRGWTLPPNSQGYLALAAAWIFQQLDPPKDVEDPAYVHAAIEAYRSVAWERDRYVTDPATAPLGHDELLDVDRLAARLPRIRRDAPAVWPAPASAPGGTAYLCTRDASGLGVSLIQSNFKDFGSLLTAGDTGVFLHDRGAGFTLEPGHPNECAPGRRPLHTLSPTLWTQNDQLRMLLGTRGGQFQPQLLVQMAAHLLWADLSPGAAQDVPRWVVDNWHEPDSPRVRFESRDGPSPAPELAKLGHDVVAAQAWQSSFGPVSVIVSAADSVEGAADPRVSTSSVAAS